MPIQSSVTVDAIVGIEITHGTAALANLATARLIRRVSSTLNTSKDSFTSAEVRSDQQIADVRHGTRRAGGSIEGELSGGSYDPEIEASMRGTFAAGVSQTQVALGTVTATAGGSTLIYSTGDPVALGFRVGDVVRLSAGAIPAGNLGTNFRIVSFGGTSNRTITVSPPVPVAMTAVATGTLSVVGKKVTNGVVRRSFTIEQRYQELDISELFVGMRVGAVSMSFPPTGIATISVEYTGINGSQLEGAAAPYFTVPLPATATGALAAVNGALRVNGADRAIVTGLDIAINNGLSATPVVGANTVPEVFYGRTVVTGNISAYFDGPDLVNAFLNETEFDIVAVFEASGVAPRDFMAFNIQRAKMSGVSKTIGADGGVIVSFPFQALLRPATAGFDATTMTVQTSTP